MKVRQMPFNLKLDDRPFDTAPTTTLGSLRVNWRRGADPPRNTMYATTSRFNTRASCRFIIYVVALPMHIRPGDFPREGFRHVIDVGVPGEQTREDTIGQIGAVQPYMLTSDLGQAVKNVRERVWNVRGAAPSP